MSRSKWVGAHRLRPFWGSSRRLRNRRQAAMMLMTGDTSRSNRLLSGRSGSSSFPEVDEASA